MSRTGKRNPRVEAREVSIFGEVDESLVEAQDGRDIFELPGYSDKRREIELRRRAGQKIDPLRFRVHLVPIQKSTGQPDYTKAAERIRRGYRFAKADELESALEHPLWDENDHPLTSYQKAPDGTVRLNEYAVMICDSRRAAANLATVDRKNRELAEAGLQRTGLSGRNDLQWEIDSSQD